MNVLTNPIHWLPLDPSVSRMTACGLDIDAKYPEGWPSWSRAQLPYGEPPTCRDCAKAAAA